MDNETYLSELIGHIILSTGPVLIDFDQWEHGLPEDAKGVVVETTQEGYLVSITNEVPEGEETDDQPTE